MQIEKRTDVFNKTKMEYEAQGYKTTEGVISILKANLMALVTAGPIAIIFFVIYPIAVPYKKMVFSPLNLIIFLVLLIGGIFVHELLHGIGWGIFCKDKKSISFGVVWKQLTPYCTCAEPLTFGKYVFGALLPLFVLGFGVFFVSLAMESTLLLALSALNVLAAGGDTTISLMLIKYRKCVIVDHPTKCGFVAFHK